jgi:membrane protein involved in colicin uptake
MGSQPKHQDVIGMVTKLCSDSICQFEVGLKTQIEADKAAREEMERVKAEAMRLAEQAAKLTAEHEALERQDKAKVEQELLTMHSSKGAAAGKKRAWSDTQDMADDDDDDDEDEDDKDSEGEGEGHHSAPDEVSIQ